jgi:hypothetical protein
MVGATKKRTQLIVVSHYIEVFTYYFIACWIATATVAPTNAVASLDDPLELSIPTRPTREGVKCPLDSLAFLEQCMAR